MTGHIVGENYPLASAILLAGWPFIEPQRQDEFHAAPILGIP
jgi:hypothetical protein